MAYVPGQVYRPTQTLTQQSEYDKDNIYTTSIYNYTENTEEDVQTKIVTNQLVKSNFKLPPAALARYNARPHDITNATSLQPPEQDFLAPNEVRSQINRQRVKTSSSMMQCSICHGPHLTQECPVRDLLKKQQSVSEKVYSCKIEPIPTGWERQDLQNFLDKRFLAVKNRKSQLEKEQSEFIRQGDESGVKSTEKLIAELREVLLGYPPKNLFIREDNQDKRWRFAFVHFKTEVTAKMCEKIIQRVEIVGENTFLYAMYTGVREFK